MVTTTNLEIWLKETAAHAGHAHLKFGAYKNNHHCIRILETQIIESSYWCNDAIKTDDNHVVDM